jgi:hypothetical protein
MAEQAQGDMFDDLGKVSKGITALKEVWGFASKVAALQEKYKGQAIPVGELFGAMLGFGDQPNPLAVVERQLSEINAKLDRVLAGIEELKVGQLGQGVLAAYLDISDPVYLIEKYFQDLVSYQEPGQSWPDAERKEFVGKLLGTRSERDSVAFCAHKIVKLSPVTQTPLLFDLLFAYLSAGATAANARQLYANGAYAFRSVAETLSKGLVLESFAIGSAGGDAKKAEAKVKAAADKYKAWMKAMTENSFLPFAERLATLDFTNEYLGGHDTTWDAQANRGGWKPAQNSILQSADELTAKLLGKSRTVTLRVIPNVPPIANIVPAKFQGAASTGTYQWEIKQPLQPQPSFTKATLLDKLKSFPYQFFRILASDGRTWVNAETVKKVALSFAEAAKPPISFEDRKLNFLRYQFDLAPLSDGAQFQFAYDTNVLMQNFPLLRMTWQRWWLEPDGTQIHRTPGPTMDMAYYLITDVAFPGYFKLPQEGQLSPVLVTYAYHKFGPA